MHYNSEKQIDFPNLKDLYFYISYTETDKENHRIGIDLHTHDKLELYINLSGDISFLVENNLYPLNRGDIIIARPGEYHHCVYRSDAMHKLFWILTDFDNKLFSFFNDSKTNFLSPNNKSREEIINFCHSLLSEEMSQLDKTYSFLRLLILIKDNLSDQNTNSGNLPQELKNVLDYIECHIAEDLQITAIAKALYLSESTIERRFKEFLKIKPSDFIRKKKMILAAELLKKGESVLNAGINCGYSDNSHFIKLFKEYYGTTPYKFKKGFLD